MQRNLIIKVCGMKYSDNRQALEVLPIDIFGMIFYPPSPRFVNPANHSTLFSLSDTPKSKAGVFVDAQADQIHEIIRLTRLTHVQLHGSETSGYCQLIRKSGISVIKAFRVDESFDFSKIEEYSDMVDFFLFDTRADKPGGTGKKFNWQLLENYKANKPFFLSGGIKPEDAEQILKIDHPQLYGIDLNSGFEDGPGLKNFELLKDFLDKILNFKL